MKIQETVFALFLLAAASSFVIGAFSYDRVARAFPLIIGIPVCIILGLQIFSRIFPKVFSVVQRLDTKQVLQIDKSLIAQADILQKGGPKRGRELTYFVWAGLFVISILLVGFMIAIPLFLMGLLCLQLKEGVWLSLAVTAVMLAITYLGFAVLMEVPLFKGIIFTY